MDRIIVNADERDEMVENLCMHRIYHPDPEKMIANFETWYEKQKRACRHRARGKKKIEDRERKKLKEVYHELRANIEDIMLHDCYYKYILNLFGDEALEKLKDYHTLRTDVQPSPDKSDAMLLDFVPLADGFDSVEQGDIVFFFYRQDGFWRPEDVWHQGIGKVIFVDKKEDKVVLKTKQEQNPIVIDRQHWLDFPEAFVAKYMPCSSSSSSSSSSNPVPPSPAAPSSCSSSRSLLSRSFSLPEMFQRPTGPLSNTPSGQLPCQPSSISKHQSYHCRGSDQEVSSTRRPRDEPEDHPTELECGRVYKKRCQQNKPTSLSSNLPLIETGDHAIWPRRYHQNVHSFLTPFPESDGKEWRWEQYSDDDYDDSDDDEDEEGDSESIGEEGDAEGLGEEEEEEEEGDNYSGDEQGETGDEENEKRDDSNEWESVEVNSDDDDSDYETADDDDDESLHKEDPPKHKVEHCKPSFSNTKTRTPQSKQSDKLQKNGKQTNARDTSGVPVTASHKDQKNDASQKSGKNSTTTTTKTTKMTQGAKATQKPDSVAIPSRKKKEVQGANRSTPLVAGNKQKPKPKPKAKKGPTKPGASIGVTKGSPDGNTGVVESSSGNGDPMIPGVGKKTPSALKSTHDDNKSPTNHAETLDEENSEFDEIELQDEK